MGSREKILEIIEEMGVIRPKEVENLGIPRQYLHRMVEQGDLERIGWGLYTTSDRLSSSYLSLAIVQKRVPAGVICLLSALQFHEITTQLPFEVWVAIEGTSWAPMVDYPSVRYHRYSGEAFHFGIEVHTIDGVPVQIYSIAKTVADCFKFRYKIGKIVAIEALRQTLSEKRATIDELWIAARVCRVTKIMKPYLEALQ